MEKKQKKEYAKIIVLGVLILVFAFSAIFNSQISSVIKGLLYKFNISINDKDLSVHYIKVGQGDAIAIRFPNSEIMLIDAGPKDSQNSLVKYLKNEVLKSDKDLAIDYLILTHSDIDHSGGVCAVFKEFEVKNFYRPNIASASENKNDYAMKVDGMEYDEAIKTSIKEKDLSTKIINQEYCFSVGKSKIEIFPPVKAYNTTNKMSPIIKISSFDKSFLFAGDIQEESESDMVKFYKSKLDADVLKVAHHGSNNSTSQEFINAVSPDYAVICVGVNTYGHPHFTTISNLENANIKVYSTFNDNVRFICNKKGIKVLSSKTTQSYEFVEWWVVATGIDVVLLINLTVVTIIFIKNKRKEEI